MAQNNTNRTVVILAVTVVVLLVAFVGVVMLTLNGGTGTQTAQTGTSTTTTDTTQQGMSPSNTGFDASTATKVPTSQTPKEFVATYYQAILDKKWDTAFKMQPAASQKGQTVEAFQQTQEQMYGMTKFSIFSSVASSSEATVVARQELGSNGVWNTTWTFQKGGSDWLVVSRIPVSGEPK